MTSHGTTGQRDEPGHRGMQVGTVRSELRSLVEPAAFRPERITDPAAAKAALGHNGAVLIPGYDPSPDAAVRAAADLLGARLHRINNIRPVHGRYALPLHTDGASERHEYRTGERRRRSFREDYLFLLCAKQADDGGDSFLADGYRLLELLHAEPAMRELVAFLTGVDLDPGALSPAPSRAVPQTLRLVEFTRSGRRIVTAPPGVGVLPFDPFEEERKVMVSLWSDVIATLTDAAPRFRIEAGEVLCLDNYRVLHGRDAFDSERVLYVLRAESIDAM